MNFPLFNVSTHEDIVATDDCVCSKCGTEQAHQSIHKKTVIRIALIPVRTTLREFKKCMGCKTKLETSAAGA